MTDINTDTLSEAYSDYLKSVFKIEYPEYVSDNSIVSVKEAHLETDLISVDSYIDIIKDKITIYLNDYLDTAVPSQNYNLPSDKYISQFSEPNDNYYLDLILSKCADDISEAGTLTLRDGEEVSLKEMVSIFEDLAAKSFSTTTEFTLNMDTEELMQESPITEIERHLYVNSDEIIDELSNSQSEASLSLLQEVQISATKSPSNIVSIVASPVATFEYFGNNILNDSDFVDSINNANSIINKNLFDGIIPDKLTDKLAIINDKMGIDQPSPTKYSSHL